MELRTPRNRPTVLIVDDMSHSISVLNAALRDEFTVKAAISGKRGLALAREQPQPDLILLNIMMPGMDGYEICQHLKADPSTENIPVIFVTGHQEENYELKGFAMDAVDYIAKPIRPNVLKARIRTHIKNSLMQKKRAHECRTFEGSTAGSRQETIDRILEHDLRTHLGNIIAAPALLADRAALPEKDIVLLRIIEESGRKMMTIISDYIRLRKMEKGDYFPSTLRLNLLPLLREALGEAAMSSAARDKNSRLQLRERPISDSDECWVQGEEMLCVSMFSNLVQNAFEASPKGGTVMIDVEPLETGVQVTITNPGAVPETIRDRFFEKYVTSGKKWATGLGTYLARLCAETLGGSIAMDCPDGTHTRVTVTLPEASGSLKGSAADESGLVAPQAEAVSDTVVTNLIGDMEYVLHKLESCFPNGSTPPPSLNLSDSGASPLKTAALDLEIACIGQKSNQMIADALWHLLIELQTALRKAYQFVTLKTQESDTNDENDEPFLHLVEQLQQYLREDDPEALNRIDDLAAYAPHEDFRVLKDTIERFDFETALVMLDRFKRRA